MNSGISENEIKESNLENPYEDYKFPRVRYRGNKQRLVSWIEDCLSKFEFTTFLDLMGGTGCVGYAFKKKGKQVFYNDILKSNFLIGKSLIENSEVKLEIKDIDKLLKPNSGKKNIIQKNYKGLYYKDKENKWLDNIIANISNLENEYKKAIAYNALFQSCIIKKPFGIWHRANLNIRLNKDNKIQTFGNGITWEKTFEYFFKRFSEEINQAIFSNGLDNKAFNEDAFESELTADIVYIDTPYMRPAKIRENSFTDYQYYYHFLEGISNYDIWENNICEEKKTKPYTANVSERFVDYDRCLEDFKDLIEKYSDTTIAFSYVEGGKPTINQLKELFESYFDDVSIFKTEHRYYLRSGNITECLFIGKSK